MLRPTPNSNFLWVTLAVIISLALHTLVFLAYKPEQNQTPILQPFSITIQTQNLSPIKTAAPIKATHTKSIDQTAPTVTLPDNSPLDIPVSSTAVFIAEDGLAIAEMTALSASIDSDTVLTALNEVVEPFENQLVSLAIEDILPATLDVSDNNHEGIAFQSVPEAIEITATDVLEVIPEISDISSSLENEDLLSGIDNTFKIAVTQQLSKGLNDLKTVIEKQKLEGNLRFQFTINRSGVLVDKKIIESSDNIILDTLVLKMLQAGSPYPTLPKKYLGEFLKFSYPINIKIK